MKSFRNGMVVVACLAVAAGAGCAKAPSALSAGTVLPETRAPRPNEVDPHMGIYEGTYTRDGKSRPAEAKLIPRGNGHYEAVVTAPPGTEGQPGLRLDLKTPGLGGSPLALYTAPDGAQKGVTYAYYEGTWDKLPDFSRLTPVKTGVADAISLAPRARDDAFALKFDGFVKIKEPGRYVFFTRSDDGSRLAIGDTVVVDNDGLHGEITKTGEIALEAGLHPIAVTYFEASGGEALQVGLEQTAAEGGALTLLGQGDGVAWEGKKVGAKLTITAADPKKGRFVLQPVERLSPTLGLKPPKGAIVLLPRGEDGRPSLDAWRNKTWRPLPDGSMEVAKGRNVTEQEFGDIRMHLEFMCPYEPKNFGQNRGNSGVYVQGRYELQVLDSFGLGPADNLCGGVYKIAVPRVDAALPPLTWQTYDIVFRAPRFSADGSLEKPPVYEEVRLNGVVIHERVVLPNPTGDSLSNEHVKTGPLMLQDHSHPVRFRNIWIEPLK